MSLIPRTSARTSDHRPLRLHEAAFLLACSEREVHNRIRRGDLPTVWCGRLRLVDSQEIAALLDGQLSLAFLAEVASGRFRVPRADDASSPPPAMTLFLEAI